MIDTATFLAYLAASLAIILAPGPAQALTLARSVSDGKRAGIMTAVGLNVGTLLNTLAAALGLSAILAESALAFSVVKYLGAGYLVYLGIRALLARPHDEAAPAAPASASGWRAFGKAVITGTLNPKVALFFLAFLPQFVDARRGPVLPQFVILGLTMAILDTIYESGLAVAAGSMAGWLSRSPKIRLWRERIMGGVMIALGLRLALAQRE